MCCEVSSASIRAMSIRRGRPSLSQVRPLPHVAPMVVVVMPALNVERTLEPTFRAIPPGVVDKVILVDNDSSDNTVSCAERLGIEVIRHPHNAGYGGNQKTAYIEALRQGADIVVMLHSDGQYDPAIITDLVQVIRDGSDIVFGSRFLMPGGARRGGMPWWRLLANRALTSVENRALGTSLSECHTGYRAYSRRFLQTVPFLRNDNDYVFDTQMMVQAIAFGFTIQEVPVRTRYSDESSSPNLWASTRYGLQTLAVMLRYRLHHLGLRSKLFAR